MATFKGIRTNHADTQPRPLANWFLHCKMVRANPDRIRRQGSEAYNEGMMNEWDLHPDSEDPKFLCYRVYVSPSPCWLPEGSWRVVVLLNIHDSMHRVFSTLEQAMKVYEGINPYTTLDGLRNRGFRTW